MWSNNQPEESEDPRLTATGYCHAHGSDEQIQPGLCWVAPLQAVGHLGWASVVRGAAESSGK